MVTITIGTDGAVISPDDERLSGRLDSDRASGGFYFHDPAGHIGPSRRFRREALIAYAQTLGYLREDVHIFARALLDVC